MCFFSPCHLETLALVQEAHLPLGTDVRSAKTQCREKLVLRINRTGKNMKNKKEAEELQERTYSIQLCIISLLFSLLLYYVHQCVCKFCSTLCVE